MPPPSARSSAPTACSTRWEGSDPAAKPIALLAHQDVVPIAPKTEADWQHPPFDGVVADGFVWGRGSWDDKGNLYSMLEAAEAMAKQGFRPKRTIYFAFGHDEEVSGLRGAKAIVDAAGLARREARLRARRRPADHRRHHERAVDSPAALIGIAEKGYATLVLTARATPGHSSMPPRETAIGMMSAALTHLENNRLPMQLRGTVAEMFDTLAPEMSGFNRVVLSNLWLFKPLLLREFAKSAATDANVRTTTALTIFNAGDKDNVLPGNAEASGEFPAAAGRHRGQRHRPRPHAPSATTRSRSRRPRAISIRRRCPAPPAPRFGTSTAPSAKSFPTWWWRPA